MIVFISIKWNLNDYRMQTRKKSQRFVDSIRMARTVDRAKHFGSSCGS